MDYSQQLAEILTELQAIRDVVPDVSGLASSADMMVLAGVGLLICGAVIGACCALAVGGWIRR